MEPLLLLIRNRATQGDAPAEVLEAIEEIADILQEVMQAVVKIDAARFDDLGLEHDPRASRLRRAG